MNAVVVLKWKFSPPDYLEQAIEISHQDYTMTIAYGKVHEAKQRLGSPGCRRRYA